MTTLAIVQVSEKETNRFMTPFEEFMATLQSRGPLPLDQRSQGAVWTGLPWERVVADGLWLIMVKAAQKRGKLITTELQVAEAAECVNRVLNVGILLLYKNGREAAQAYVFALHESIERERRRASVRPIHTLWSKESAMFFANALKRAQEYRTELVELEARREAIENGLPLRRAQTFSLNIQDRLEYLDVTKSYPASDTRDMTKIVLRAKDEVQREIMAFTVGVKLPIRTQDIPSDIAEIYTTWDPGNSMHVWLKTQLLLAAADLPDKEHLESEEFTVALRALRKIQTDPLISLFFTRMERRSSQLLDSERCWLAPELRNDIQELRKWDDIVDRHILTSCILRIPPEDVEVSSGAAQELLFGDANGRISSEQIAAKIRWEDVNEREFKNMLNNGDYSLETLVEYAPRLSQGLRKDAWTWLVEAFRGEIRDGYRASDHEDMLHGLLTFPSMKPTYGFYRDFIGYAAPIVVQQQLNRIIRLTAEPKSFEAAEALSVFLGALNRLEKREFGKVLKRTRIRKHLADLLLQIDESEAASLFLRADAVIFKRRVGAAFWSRAVLASEILLRQGEYEDLAALVSEKSQVPTPWARIHQGERGECLRHLLGLQKIEDIAAIAKRYSQEYVIQWLHPRNAKESTAHWAEYKRLREAYNIKAKALGCAVDGKG